MYVRQREQGEVISKIGDIFLNAATEFRFAYPTYMGQLPGAERRLKGEMEANGDFRVFLEVRTGFSRMCDRPSVADLFTPPSLIAMRTTSGQCDEDGPEALAQPSFGASSEVPRRL